MGKKKLRSKYVSKGIVGLNKSIHKACRRARPAIDTELNKFEAFRKGKRVWFTIQNPDKQATNKRFIRVLGSDLYGDWRRYV